jgi:hypothetical protein
MKGALARKETVKALQYLASTSMKMYQYNLELMADYLGQIVQEMANINLIELRGAFAEYEMLVTRDGVELAFPVVFVKDANGVWKISFF